jgi:hypothetical protein
MTISSALTALNTDIVNARTAITNKGGTVTSGGGSSQLAADIATIPSGGSAPVITSLSVIPTTSAQTITAPSGTDGYSPVNVSAVTASIDANITAGNIKKNVSILGVTGTYEDSKYGCNIENFLPSSADTVSQSNFSNVDIVLPSSITKIGGRAFSYKFYFSIGPETFSAQYVTDLSARAFEYAFYNDSQLSSIDFSSVKIISNTYVFDYAFCLTGIKNASFPELEEISGNNVFSNAWYACKLDSINFPKLKTVSGNNVFQSSFAGNNTTTGAPLTSASFPLLDSITGSGIFSSAFNTRYNLASLSFPALKTTSFGSNVNQFNKMFNSNTGSTATGGCTVHFPSNLQSTVSGLTGYPTFGGSSSHITISFDLPATS